MSVIADLPDIRPSLLLDFASSGRVDPRISLARASTATYCGPDGVLRTVANNVPRVDYDPESGKCLGLLIEETRTNTGTPLIASGSVPQVPTYTYNADLPPLVVGRVPVRNYAVGAVDASSAAGDRANIRGNPSGLVAGATYTVSEYVYGVAGGATRATLYFSLAGMQPVTTSIDLIVGRWRRISLTFTVPEGVSGTGAVRLAGSGGLDPLQPFGADGYQFEAGSWASSLIPTTDVAVTRAAEVPTIPLDNSADVTIAIAWEEAGNKTGFLWQMDAAGSGATRLRLAYSAANDLQAVLTTANTPSTVTVAGPANISAGLNAVAVAFSSSSITWGRNGVGGAAVNSRAALPATTILRLGSSQGGTSQPNFRLKRLAIYRRALTQAQLQRLTA